MKNIIEETIKNHVKDLNAVFVFPTQTAADMWADRIITTGPVTAVAMERFMAWDDFKGRSIRSQHQDKQSVPSVMRQIFATVCIAQNAEKPFLNSLIVPEYAKTADGFTNWISGLLPGLSMWKNRFEKSGATPDAEDKDLMELYRRYKAFLDQFSLFDPAWETPPFEADGHHYYIFFPEILSDYQEYEEILNSSPADITVINIPEEVRSKEPAEVSFFSNSRTEIKSAAVYIRKIHEEKNIPWTEIALSVPDMDTYGPYVERELELFQIPHVVRNAKPLSSNGAGHFFSQLKDCVNQNFSFGTVKALLLNDSLPWKSQEALRQLINFGINNNCITSYTYNGDKVDVWEKSFREAPQEQRAASFYNSLKYHGTALVNARNFKELRDLYFQFRKEFFEMEKCSEKSDRILSRCISGLAELIDIEDKFNLNKENGQLNLKSCYNFFTETLDSSKYLEQTDELGVAVLPYKLAATAPYSVQVVVDSSQTSLSVIYKELSFLREDKRKKLTGLTEDPNVTDLFVKLYEMNAVSGNFYFSAANKTFTGYSQASSYLKEVSYVKDESACSLLAGDFFAGEKAWFSQRSAEFPLRVAETERLGFDFWKNSQKLKNSDSSKAQTIISEKIAASNFFEGGKLKISPTMLKSYFKCPRLWLFNSFCSLEKQNNEAELFDHKAIGNLYHKFFEIFCDTLKEKNLPVHTTAEGLEENYLAIFNQSLLSAMKQEKSPFLARELLSATQEKFRSDLLASVNSFMQYFEGCVVLETESSYSYEVPEKNYICNGRIDCLLQDPSDSARILVDFKSFDSAIPSNLYADSEADASAPLEEQELPDFQMPMYAYLLKNQPSPKVVENVCFFQVSKGELKYVFGENLFARYKNVNPGKKTKQVSEEEYEPTMKLFMQALERINQRILANDFSLNDISQSYEKCFGCADKAICRRTFNISREK